MRHRRHAPTDVGQRFTDTFAYKDLELTFTFSRYLIKHGEEYMVWDTGFAPGTNPNAPKDGIVDRLRAARRSEPLEFMERLPALVPRPRLHLIRFHGVLAPNAKLGGQCVPAPASPPTESPKRGRSRAGRAARVGPGRLGKHVFDVNVEHCPNCGGALKIIAAPSTGSGTA